VAKDLSTIEFCALEPYKMFLDVSLTSSAPSPASFSCKLFSTLPSSKSEEGHYHLINLPLSPFYGLTSTNLIRKLRKTVSKRERPPMKAKGPLKPTSRLRRAPTKRPDRLPITKENV
jgi:hypothetical protein